MKKTTIITLILLLILAIGISFLLTNSESNLDYYTQTKAICNETNYCQDYQVSCDEKRAIMRTPITGAVVQFSENWTDPRTESDKELCN